MKLTRRFYRRGKVGGYADEMSEEMIEKFDNWIIGEFEQTDFDFASWI